MGWWGSLIVGRSAQPIAELTALEHYGQTLELGDGWQVWAHNGDELAARFVRGDLGEEKSNIGGWLPALAGECRSPVLTAFFFDSDCADLRGFGTEAGWWWACLNRESTQGYLADNDLELDEMFPSAEAAAQRGAKWSAEAGYASDERALVRVFEAEAPFAEDLFDDLLDALGLP